MRFSSKVALVTGGASGIGRSVVERFANEGARVALADINSELGPTISSEFGSSVIYLKLDVTKEDDWNTAIAETIKKFGRLDILVNNAGIGDTGRIQDTSLDEWNKVISVTQTSVFLGLKAAYEELKKTKGNSVITSSMYGIVGSSIAGPAYHAAKGAVRMLAKNAALAWVEDGIRVNSVHPGFIDTPILGGTDRGRLLASLTPMKRLGRPEDVASLIAYLASDEAEFITGSEFVADGGYTAG